MEPSNHELLRVLERIFDEGVWLGSGIDPKSIQTFSYRHFRRQRVLQHLRESGLLHLVTEEAGHGGKKQT